ncbi:MAG TPA: hypothetical protein VGD65_23095 [Chryseosolibacter sp.]
MRNSTINKLIGYGILIFALGFFLGIFLMKYLQMLMPVGSLITFIGVFYFFRKTDLNEQFRKDPTDDFLTYFWDVIVLKLWTAIFVIWMLVMDLVLLTKGFLS